MAKGRLNKDGSDPFGTAPLDLEVTDQRSVEKAKRKYVKPADYGKCPRCTAAKVAVIRHGDHLFWKEHTIATYGQARFTCEASGQRVCDLPEGQPTLHHSAPMTCPCGGK